MKRIYSRKIARVRDAESKARWRRKHPEIYSKASREWRKRNPTESRAIVNRSYRKHQWKRRLFRLYKLTESEYQAMLQGQRYRCAICNARLQPGANGKAKMRGHIDHDHTTGKVRAILCFNCNVGLGNLRDRIDIVQATLDYLKAHAE